MAVQFESNVKHVPYSQERVYNKLSDLNNLEGVRERLDMVKDKIWTGNWKICRSTVIPLP